MQRPEREICATTHTVPRQNPDAASPDDSLAHSNMHLCLPGSSVVLDSGIQQLDARSVNSPSAGMIRLSIHCHLHGTDAAPSRDVDGSLDMSSTGACLHVWA